MLLAPALQGESPQDMWDFLGLAVTFAASCVYTVEWFKTATREPDDSGRRVVVGLHAPPRAASDSALQRRARGSSAAADLEPGSPTRRTRHASGDVELAPWWGLHS